MVSPLVFGGASYREAQPVVALALVTTFVFGALALPSRVAPPGVDPLAHALGRRHLHLFQTTAALLVIGFTSLIEFGIAYTDLDRLRSSAAPIGLEDVAAGSWTGVLGLCAAGFALILTIAAKFSAPPALPRALLRA